jgi:hypothetical protein
LEDVRAIFLSGGLLLPRIDGDGDGDATWSYNEHNDRVTGLLDGGEHEDDYSRQQELSLFRRNVHLPYKVLLSHVLANKFTSPE